MLAVSDKLSLHSTPGFSGFCTRRTGNVQLVASIPATISDIRIWQQNDEPGQKWAAQIPEFIPKTCRHTTAAVPEKFGDVNDWTRAGASANDLLRAIEGKKRKPKITVRSPSEILAYEPPPDIVLVGDNHHARKRFRHWRRARRPDRCHSRGKALLGDLLFSSRAKLNNSLRCSFFKPVFLASGARLCRSFGRRLQSTLN
jgi:hypothetical protein